MLNNCKFAVYEFNCTKDDRSERKRMIVLKCGKAIKNLQGWKCLLVRMDASAL